MSQNNVMDGPVAVLRLPKSNEALLRYAKRIQTAMTGNAALSSPDPTMAVFGADIGAYDKADTAAATHALGTAQARDAARVVVLRDLRNLRAYVQKVADLQATAAEAAAVITSAGMGVKIRPKRDKPPLEVRNGSMAGMVVLIAKAIAEYATYYWSYSVDQKNWTSAPDTVKASTVISGLTSGQTYYFRFRGLSRAGQVDWSQVVSIIVH